MKNRIGNQPYVVAVFTITAMFLPGCLKRSAEWDSDMTPISKPKGLIRIIPINPLDGTTYPSGTYFPAGSKQITFKHGETSNVWFALELSGWGPTLKLVGYSADIHLTYAYCPRPPCGCASTYLLEPGQLPCTIPANCPTGSTCLTTPGLCTTAYIDKSASDFVFNSMSSTPTVTSAFPDYAIASSLTSGAKADPGYPLIGGNLIFRSADFCGADTGVQVSFDSANPPKFYLFDGYTVSTVYPISEGAVFYSEKP